MALAGADSEGARRAGGETGEWSAGGIGTAFDSRRWRWKGRCGRAPPQRDLGAEIRARARPAHSC
jgi:hypothetical protein